MQLPPSVWGPFFWHTIHITALGYSKTPTYADKKSAKEFYEALAYLIPCPVCKEHYKEYLKKNPLTPFLDSRTDLIKWTIMLHNQVNKIAVTNKKIKNPDWTLEEVLMYYERLGKRDRSPVWTRDDMNEVDYRSFIKGFITGAALLSVVGGTFYFINTME